MLLRLQTCQTTSGCVYSIELFSSLNKKHVLRKENLSTLLSNLWNIKFLFLFYLFKRFYTVPYIKMTIFWCKKKTDMGKAVYCELPQLFSEWKESTVISRKRVRWWNSSNSHTLARPAFLDVTNFQPESQMFNPQA